MWSRWLFALFAVVYFFPATTVFGTTFYFNNGDRLTGKIISFTSRTVTVDARFGGEVSFSRDILAGFETDSPVTVRFGENRYLTGIITPLDNRLSMRDAEGNTLREFRMDEFDRVFKNDPRDVLRDELTVKVTGNVNAGLNKQEGNTNKEAYHFNGQVRARTPKNRYTFSFEYNEEENSDVITEENAVAFAKYDHFVNHKWYVFSSTTLEHDSFENLDLQSNLSTGIGYQFYETEKRFLLLETGASYTNETYEDNTPSISYMGTRYSLDYERTIRNVTEFFHYQEGFVSTGDEGDFDFRSRTGFRFPMTSGLQSSLQLNLDWTQDPLAGNVSTDRQYMFTLGYSF